MKIKENIYNIPNALSAYRILALPFITYALVTQDRTLFITLISINLITDILDGLIARAFQLQTELGARLDSLADIGTYIMAFSGMTLLEWDFVTTYRWEFILLISMWILPQLIALLRFRRFPSFHLYSNKITGYIQGIFIFTYFLFGLHQGYFYFMLAFSCLAYLEELLLIILLPELRSNLKSIFVVFSKKT
ncbi:MAG TPA: CDP-alcohol phosphatidyltransferase family protein [Sphingobacterium sp.]|nr:CDP-alcohol phosphatidyltransferase family protein [Sphingobacterium sp.]